MLVKKKKKRYNKRKPIENKHISWKNEAGGERHQYSMDSCIQHNMQVRLQHIYLSIYRLPYICPTPGRT